MFGYVVVNKPSLRIKEYDYYKATYCGLCHAMGKCTGCISRLTLSYDMTFFALLRETLQGTEVQFKSKRCIRHPIKRVPTVEINPELEYCSYLSGILTAGKIADNISDEKGIKRVLASVLQLVFSKMDRESSENLPDLALIVDKKLAELDEIQEKKIPSIDVPANIFGELMAEALAYGIEDDKKLIALQIGKRLGRWIYIADALDDYESDRNSGSYNPFVLLYNGEDFTEDNIISISKMLEAELALALSAIDLLDNDADKNRSEIIKNILCLGMPASVARICDKHINKIRRI